MDPETGKSTQPAVAVLLQHDSLPSRVQLWGGTGPQATPHSHPGFPLLPAFSQAGISRQKSSHPCFWSQLPEGKRGEHEAVWESSSTR